MSKLPDTILQAWADRDGAIILATTDADATPNIIYATCVSIYNGEYVVIADNYFNKTRQNIQRSNKASLLFITKEKKAYQLKGTLEYHTSGPIFDDMKIWNPTKHPGHGAAALKVHAIYSGAQQIS